MKFIADLHVHSKYSRATARNLDLENLYYAAQIKGITLVGTGDFTYPAWIEEIRSKLEEAEPGLFCLKKEIAENIDKTVPATCRHPVRFILQTEISNIYKKDGRVRKNHNLVYFPDIASVEKFNAKLDTIGNIKSDGRPILGLDAADLLSIMLDTSDNGFFVPAHIWTPWFSMFGSKSGFDSIKECFGSLAEHIFAVETGLSSDPPMNWRISDLDNVRLISNSDAHSPGYIGRNASVFNTKLSFFHIRQALEKNDLEKYHGTLDMFPHQGKYHYDGHRKCNICLNPSETAKIEGICPVCGRRVTCGVLNRVRKLASRPEGYLPENRQGFKSIIPLADILSEIFDVGPKTKKVAGHYDRAVKSLGPELSILLDQSFEEIENAHVPLLAEAIMKMRKGNISIDPGFDGEYGKIGLFTRKEKERLKGEKYFLFDLPAKKKRTKIKKRPSPKKNQQTTAPIPDQNKSATEPGDLLNSLNTEQRRTVESFARAMVIQAGPGTGKTRTLTAKIAHLVSKKKIDPGNILALTFTNKAAEQLTRQIDKYMPQKKTMILSATFHSFCLKLLKKYKAFNAVIVDDVQRASLILQAIGGKPGQRAVKKTDQLISQCKQNLIFFDDDLSKIIKKNELESFKKVYHDYNTLCRELNVVDFEDLVFMTVQMLIHDRVIRSQIQQKYQYVFIDEYQDLNFGQYELVKLICEKNHLVVIGDPDQSIYGFRGSDNRFFKHFALDFPGCEKISLTKNYRSTQTILDASFQMISKSLKNDKTLKVFSDMGRSQKIIIQETATERAEAVAIGKMIEKMMGGTSFFSMDAGRTDDNRQKEYSFADFAVLYRTRRQCEVFIDIFGKEGIPFQTADKKKLFEIQGIRQLIEQCRSLSDTIDLPDKLKGKVCDTKTILNFLRKNKDLDKLIKADNPAGQAFETLLSRAELYPSLKDFLNALVLNRDADTLEYETQKVSLMTMHAAKGLEFPVVFVSGCEQGLIPFAKDGKTIDDPEEERRLFYVAMTRAMDILCLTYAGKRSIYGRRVKRQRSFFIGDIEKKLTRSKKSAALLAKKKKVQQLELF